MVMTCFVAILLITTIEGNLDKPTNHLLSILYVIYSEINNDVSYIIVDNMFTIMLVNSSL
jgi:hypothetical protein